MSLSPEFSRLVVPIGILVMPFAAVLLRYVTLHGTDEVQTRQWIRFLGVNHAFCLATLVVWCTFWSTHLADGIPWPFFWITPLANSFFVHLTSRAINRAVLARRWSIADLLKQVLWASAHPTSTLLMIAIGFYGMFERRIFSIVWFPLAGAVALVATAMLRYVQGFRRRRVKSGTVYVTTMRMAKRVGVRIERVYVVPAGKGKLTNAFGSALSIAITDNFGEYLNGPDLDYVIGHELAHAKNRHTRNEFILVVALFSILSVFSFIVAPLVPRYQPGLVLFDLLAAILTYYAISRRFEYEADLDALRFTGDPEAGIRALAALYEKTGAAVERSTFSELFATHPNLLNRVSAIARFGNIPSSRVSQIFAESGIAATDVSTAQLSHR